MSRPASGGNAILNLGVLALVVAVLCLLPMMTTPYYIRVATGVAMWAGIALSWNVICGYAGYISFGHVAFFGIGAYTTAILMQPDHGWNFWATLPVAAVVAGAVAALVGWPALRLKGAYFAIATWALAEAVRELTTVLDFTGGSRGLTTPIRLDDNFFFYTMLAAAAIAYAVVLSAAGTVPVRFPGEGGARQRGRRPRAGHQHHAGQDRGLRAERDDPGRAGWHQRVLDHVHQPGQRAEHHHHRPAGGDGARRRARARVGSGARRDRDVPVAGAAPGQLRRDDRIHHHRRRAGDGGRAVSARRAGQPRPASTTNAARTPATRPRPRRRRAAARRTARPRRPRR